jgi:predicted DNA-binding protein
MNDKQDKQISVRIPADIAELLDNYCQETELSKNRVIILSVREFLISEKAERIKDEL